MDEDEETETFEELIFGHHSESGCPGDFYKDHDNVLVCTKDDECPTILFLFESLIKNN